MLFKKMLIASILVFNLPLSDSILCKGSNKRNSGKINKVTKVYGKRSDSTKATLDLSNVWRNKNIKRFYNKLKSNEQKDFNEFLSKYGDLTHSILAKINFIWNKYSHIIKKMHHEASVCCGANESSEPDISFPLLSTRSYGKHKRFSYNENEDRFLSNNVLSAKEKIEYKNFIKEIINVHQSGMFSLDKLLKSYSSLMLKYNKLFNKELFIYINPDFIIHSSDDYVIACNYTY